MVFYVKAVVAATFYSASKSLRAFFAGNSFKKIKRKDQGSFTFFTYYTGAYSKKIFRKVIKRLTSPFLFC